MKVKPCPVCGLTNYKNDRLAQRMLGLKDGMEVLLCRNCGQRILFPQLSESDFEDLYSEAYFNSEVHGNFGKREGIRMPDYIADVVIGRYDKFRRSLTEMKSLFPTAERFLDVGAATGDMVHLAREDGLDAEGIELSEFAAQQARDRFGLELKQIPLVEVADAQYDLVHLNHVFEHFNDPVDELNHLHRIIKPGGGLYIEIPYQFHIIERLKYRLRPKQVPYSLHSIHHPYFYTPHTIKKILKDNGFRILQFRVFSLDRYTTATFTQKVKVILWWAMSKLQVGNYMELIAIKK